MFLVMDLIKFLYFWMFSLSSRLKNIICGGMFDGGTKKKPECLNMSKHDLLHCK